MVKERLLECSVSHIVTQMTLSPLIIKHSKDFISDINQRSLLFLKLQNDLQIVNFPFMLINIPFAPAYGVSASQLICYAHYCSNYSDFLSGHRALVTRLCQTVTKFVHHLFNASKKFCDRPAH